MNRRVINISCVAILVAMLLTALWPLKGTRASAYDLFTQTVSVTVGGTSSETTVIGTGIGSTTIPAGFLQASDKIRFVILGHLSTAALTPGTLRIRIKLGSSTIADTGAQNLASGVSNSGVFGLSFTTCRTVGASGSLMTQGRFAVPSGLLTDATWPMVNTSAATVDTSTNQTADVTVEFSNNSASNTITITNLHISRAP